MTFVRVRFEVGLSANYCQEAEEYCAEQPRLVSIWNRISVYSVTKVTRNARLRVPIQPLFKLNN